MTLADLSPELQTEARRLFAAIPDGSKPYGPGMTPTKASAAIDAWHDFLAAHRIDGVFLGPDDFSQELDTSF